MVSWSKVPQGVSQSQNNCCAPAPSFQAVVMPWGCQGDCHTFTAPETDLSKDREREREKHVAVAKGLEWLGKQQRVQPQAQSVKCSECDEKEGDTAWKVGKERKENKHAGELVGKMDLREELRSITPGTLLPLHPPNLFLSPSQL